MKPYNHMEDFILTVEDSDFSDLGFVGGMFTWSNNREGG